MITFPGSMISARAATLTADGAAVAGVKTQKHSCTHQAFEAELFHAIGVSELPGSMKYLTVTVTCNLAYLPVNYTRIHVAGKTGNTKVNADLSCLDDIVI